MGQHQLQPDNLGNQCGDGEWVHAASRKEYNDGSRSVLSHVRKSGHGAPTVCGRLKIFLGPGSTDATTVAVVAVAADLSAAAVASFRSAADAAASPA